MLPTPASPRRAALIVLDGVGFGAAPDAADYGDAGSDTLGNVARAVGGLALPNLERLGLGRCGDLPGVRPVPSPQAAWGVAIPASAGKDSSTGHWELTGLRLEQPFRTWPEGFSPAFVEAFAAATGRGVLGNRPASGTQILEELGEQHLATGQWILYTSADSVCQIAAHEERVPLAELYRACLAARGLLVGEDATLRVIARPFTGTVGAWQRTDRRRDFSLPPPGETLLDRLQAAHIPRVGVGKVDDLFAGRGITRFTPGTTRKPMAPSPAACGRCTAGCCSSTWWNSTRAGATATTCRGSTAACWPWTRRCPPCWPRCGRTIWL